MILRIPIGLPGPLCYKTPCRFNCILYIGPNLQVLNSKLWRQRYQQCRKIALWCLNKDTFSLIFIISTCYNALARLEFLEIVKI